jgi:hypothetical protein
MTSSFVVRPPCPSVASCEPLTVGDVRLRPESATRPRRPQPNLAQHTLRALDTRAIADRDEFFNFQHSDGRLKLMERLAAADRAGGLPDYTRELRQRAAVGGLSLSVADPRSSIRTTCAASLGSAGGRMCPQDLSPTPRAPPSTRPNLRVCRSFGFRRRSADHGDPPDEGGALLVQIWQQKVPVCRYFKPSPGLEPGTASLP